MVRASVEQIGEALGNEITDWRERQIEALNDVQFPQIDGEPGYLKTAAWLNFGVNTTKELFPESTLASIIQIASRATKKYKVPIYILGMAQDGFEILYNEIIRDHNLQLRTRFEELRDDFIRRVQRISREFRDSPYGRNCIQQIQQFIGSREFRDGNEVNAFCRRLINAANLVQTDPAVIRRLTNEGFAHLCNKIFDIYRGMRRGPGQNEMWYASSSQDNLWRDGSRGPAYRQVRRESDEFWILAHAWQMETHHRDEPFWARRPDVTHVRRVNRADSPMHLARTYRGETLNLAEAERQMGGAEQR
jgi:hypothetical protein